MFLSTSHNKIDKKGRISVPRNFRTYLDLEGGSLILFKSLQFKCIEGTTLKRITQNVAVNMDYIHEINDQNQFLK